MHVKRPAPAWKTGAGRTHVVGQAAVAQQLPSVGQASAHCSSSRAHCSLRSGLAGWLIRFRIASLMSSADVQARPQYSG